MRFVREIFPVAKGGAAVICVSQQAWEIGVRPGLPLAEARSMAAPGTPSSSRQKPTDVSAETLFFEWSPQADRNALIELAEHARMFAPVIGLDESPVPDSLMMDITGCGQLFGGESVLAERLIQQYRRQGFDCRAIISDHVASAWAFSHLAGHLLQQQHGPADISRRFDQSWQASTIIIPPGQSSPYLDAFPVAAARLSLSDIQLLSELGILTLRQLIQLPIADLPSRLSDSAVRRIRQITGSEEELITSIPEANPIVSSWMSDIPASNRSEIRQVLMHLVEEITPQLQHRALGATQLRAILRHEDNSTDLLETEFVCPLTETSAMQEVLKLRVESLRVTQPIFSVRMTVTTAPLPIARQKDLFSANEHLQPQEELAAVINRLNGRLGRTSVLTSQLGNSPVPESLAEMAPIMASNSNTARQNAERIIQNLVDPDHANCREIKPCSRPLFLLPEPVRVGDSALPNQDGFLFEGRKYHTTDFIGPERIQTNWWHNEAIHRDYFHVKTTDGSEFWLFQELTERNWFLHGIFE